ncbi:TPA: DUF2806 domain-containing protein [Stenotrophomonas maltophilia]
MPLHYIGENVEGDDLSYPGEALFIRFMEIAERNFIVPFVSPWKVRREGRAAIDLQRDQMLALAQAEKEVEKIRSGELVWSPDTQRLESPRSIDVSPQPARASTSGSAAVPFTTVALRMLRREVNVAKAMVRAGDILLNEDHAVPDKEPDSDWLDRWRESAAAVSAEKMQELWAQVLAREVRSPGSLSLRALDLLRNLDSGDAQLIERLASVALHKSFVYHPPQRQGDTSPGMSDRDALDLQELGFLGGVEAQGLTVTWDSAATTQFLLGVTCGDHGLAIRGPNAEAKITLQGYKVTAVGRQILQLVEAVEVDAPYLEAVAAHIKGQGFDVEIGKVKSRDAGGVEFVNLRPV